MSTIINADTSNGLKLTSDTSGEIELQANGVTKAKITANGLQDNNGNSLRGGMYRNLIINGDMRIDQRNAGASVTPGNGVYTIDRWAANQFSPTGKFSVQQNAGSVTPPQGFTHYLGVTSSSAYSVSTNDIYGIYHFVEGYNIANLNWGTANAKTITLSFWVRSSLTGTFAASIRNGVANRSYPFTYTISSADTWEQKSVTISGDITGTWATNHTAGLLLHFSLGAGTGLNGTANSWQAGSYASVSGATSVVGTSGATWQITGIQLEVGEGASDFEHLPYDVQLQRCQRYYWQLMVNPDVNSRHKSHDTTTHFGASGAFPVTMRIDNPSGTEISAPTLANCTVFGVYSDGNSYNIIVSPTSANIAYYIKEGLYGFSAEL